MKNQNTLSRAIFPDKETLFSCLESLVVFVGFLIYDSGGKLQIRRKMQTLRRETEAGHNGKASSKICLNGSDNGEARAGDAFLAWRIGHHFAAQLFQQM